MEEIQRYEHFPYISYGESFQVSELTKLRLKSDKFSTCICH